MMRMIYYHHFETNQSIFGMLGIDLSSYSALKESCETICEFKFKTFGQIPMRLPEPKRVGEAV